MDNKLLGERIKDRRKELCLTLQDIANEIGVAKSTIQRYENNSIENIKLPVVEAIARVLSVNPSYLLGKDNSKEKCGTFGEFNAFSVANVLQLSNTKKIPLLGSIACGKPIFANENINCYVETEGNFYADFALRCKGDSMVNARINDGDIVFICKQQIVDNGQIAAVIIDDEATLKRVFYYPNEDKLSLVAENSRYAPLIYIGEELNRVRILGKAVAFQSNIT